MCAANCAPLASRPALRNHGLLVAPGKKIAVNREVMNGDVDIRRIGQRRKRLRRVIEGTIHHGRPGRADIAILRSHQAHRRCTPSPTSSAPRPPRMSADAMGAPQAIQFIRPHASGLPGREGSENTISCPLYMLG